MAKISFREAAGVSESSMNIVYDALRTLPIEILKAVWLKADPYESAHDALLRYQISFTVERLHSGRWSHNLSGDSLGR